MTAGRLDLAALNAVTAKDVDNAKTIVAASVRNASAAIADEKVKLCNVCIVRNIMSATFAGTARFAVAED